MTMMNTNEVKLTRETVVVGLDALRTFLFTGNNGERFATSSPEYTETVKAMHVLEEQLDEINVVEYKAQGKEFFASTPCRHTKKEPKPKQVRKPKAKWNKENIKVLLETNAKFLERAIVKVYEKQTQDEQQTQSTNHNNNVGFNSSDSFILSSFAQQIIKSTYPEGNRLSLKQKEIALPKMLKYSNQIAKISNNM